MSYNCSKYGVRDRLGAVVEGQSPSRRKGKRIPRDDLHEEGKKEQRI